MPLFFIHPSLGPGVTRVQTPVVHSDLYPTLLDLAGADVPAGLDGRSLARTVAPRPLFARAISWYPVAVRVGRYKAVRAGPGAEVSLYDLERDSAERRDLAASEPLVATTLGALIERSTLQRRRADGSFSAAEDLPAVWVAPTPAVSGGE